MTAKKRKLDFSDVKERSVFRTTHMPPGDYAATVISVADETSSNDNDMWVYAIKLKGGRGTYPYRCTLTKKSLWKVRNLLVAGGLKVPQKLVMVDPNKVVGKEIGITLEDDEYEGTMRSQIADVFPVSELSEEARNAAPEVDDDEDDEESEDSEDEVIEVDEDELEELDIDEV